ncbi:hypothetical protein COUCH_00445 [Couchioplanes caeruleus]|uniref:hypothetical protein n=1 Tax=Couchioplanes caeruleus TaxID=56438 RepID=UPI0020C101D4|nr:hypothetical protein [Couchioplanes caeruleus]UQU64872.1 hypothetical protein COUCH_00445 [Couchioplanes caeruleus]
MHNPTHVYVTGTTTQPGQLHRAVSALVAAGCLVTMSTVAPAHSAAEIVANAAEDLDAVAAADVVAVLPGAEATFEAIFAGAWGIPVRAFADVLNAAATR